MPVDSTFSCRSLKPHEVKQAFSVSLHVVVCNGGASRSKRNKSPLTIPWNIDCVVTISSIIIYYLNGPQANKPYHSPLQERKIILNLYISFWYFCRVPNFSVCILQEVNRTIESQESMFLKECISQAEVLIFSFNWTESEYKRSVNPF